MSHRIAYMPLSTDPETVADTAIIGAAKLATELGFELHVTAFSVDVPNVHKPLLGGLLLDVPGLARAFEEKSKAECLRLKGLLENSSDLRSRVDFSTRRVLMGAALDAAAIEARYYDFSVLPWSAETTLAQDMCEAVLFGSGRPVILVPPSASPVNLDHIAIAWDESRVAARALGDALSLLPEGGRISILTVKDDKPLSSSDIAASLALSLEKRGFKAAPCNISLGERTIDEALQDAAMTEGAQLLAMGGFGHSRLREFVLGGATMGVLANLRLPTLLSH